MFSGHKKARVGARAVEVLKMSMKSISGLFTTANGASQDHLEFYPNPRAHVLERANRWLSDRLKRGKHEVFAEPVELTPELASLLLVLNTHNRTVKENVLNKYVVDISEGRFPLNGETIIVCKDDVLGDGQHRCLAVTMTGKSVNVIVVFGIDPEARTTMDQGTAKTAGDFLHMESYSDANALAATANKLIQIEKYGKFSIGSESPTKQQILEYAREHPDIAESLRVVGKPRGIANKTLLAAAHYLMSRKDREAADYFIQRLIDGTGLSKTDAIYVLREKLRSKEKRLTSNEQMKAIIMAWNNWRSKRQVKTVTHFVKKGVKLPELQ